MPFIIRWVYYFNDNRMKLDLSNDFDKNKAVNYLNTLIEKGKKIELKEVKLKRSVKHNAYLHVAITLYAIHFGYSIDEAKTFLKREAGLIYQKNNQTFLKQTRSMESDKLSLFIEWIRNYSAKQGCYIPTSEEYLQNQFEIDREIYNNQTHL